MAGAKQYHKAPFLIAQAVVDSLAGEEMFSKAEMVKPGFINLRTIKGKGWPAKEAVPSNHAMRGPAFAGADEALAAMRAELAALQ